MTTTIRPANIAETAPTATPTATYFTPLELEKRPTVDTAAAAHYLHKAPQTLRIWACKENGPIRPRRVGANLHWPLAEIRKLLGVSQQGFASVALLAGIAALVLLVQAFAPGLIDLTSFAMLGAAGVIKFTEADTAARAGAALAENCLDAMNGLDDQADHANVLAKGLIDLQKLKHHEHAAAGFSGALVAVIERGLSRVDSFTNHEIPNRKLLNAEQNRILDMAYFAQEHGEDVFWADVAADIAAAADVPPTSAPLPWRAKV